MGTNSIGTLLGTGNIGHAGIVGDISGLLNEFVGRSVISSVTRSGHFGSAVQNKLNGKINVVPLPLASNFDAVSQRRKSTVGPARSA